MRAAETHGPSTERPGTAIPPIRLGSARHRADVEAPRVSADISPRYHRRSRTCIARQAGKGQAACVSNARPCGSLILVTA